MSSRVSPHHGTPTTRDVLQPALQPQLISYHAVSRQRLVETTELGLAAAGVLGMLFNATRPTVKTSR